MLFFPDGTSAKFYAKIESRNFIDESRCYYVTPDSELSIMPKLSSQQRPTEHIVPER